MAMPTAQEQLMLELINRARLDPAAEAVRQGIALNSGLAANAISTSAKQALAFNFDLVDAARAHSVDMNTRNYFAHNTFGSNADPGQRMTAAGYDFTGTWGWGENIAASAPATNTEAGLATAIVGNHNQLYASTHGHRQQIFSDGVREIGIGQDFGYVEAGWTSGSIVTQDFATTASRTSFLTGVVYDDGVANNDFYDVGEGRGGVSISIAGGPIGMATWSAGGYGIANVTGTKTVTFSGGGLAAAVSANVTMPGSNVKLDLVDGNTIQSSATTTLGAGAVNLVMLGAAAQGLGNEVANSIIGSNFANTIRGLGGNDNLNGLAGNDLIAGGDGVDIMRGGAGNDLFDFNSVSQSGVTATTRDRILDFVRGADRIDLLTIDTRTDLAGDQAFVFRGTGTFTGAGQVRYYLQDLAGTANDRTIIEINTVGSAPAEFQIELVGLHALMTADFIL